MSFWEEALRGICAWLCNTIYPLIAGLYDIFMGIATINFFDNDLTSEIYKRVTLMLTIIMVFYVTFEFVKYVIEPEGITDKEKGVGKILYKMIAVIVLIAYVPTIFQLGFKLQKAIIDNQIIPKIILGQTNINNKAFGATFAGSILEEFYYLEEPEYSDEECGAGDDECGAVVKSNINGLKQEGTFIYGITYGINDEDSSDEKPYIHFDGIFALVIGACTLYMIALYAVGAAVRYCQLLFLQIIAPIPIIGYLSVKKDGIFEKWVKQCFSTYIDVFIRVMVFYIVILLCNVLGTLRSNGDLFPTLSGFSGTIAYFMLILGLLAFAKKAPKLLEELFPKMGAASGDFGFSGDNAKMVAKGAGLTLGASKFLGGAVAHGVNTHRRNKKNGKKFPLSKEGIEQRKEERRRKRELRNMPGERKKAEDKQKAIDERNDALENLRNAHEARKKAEAEGKPQSEIEKLKAKETAAVDRVKKANENYRRFGSPVEKKNEQISNAKTKMESARRNLEQAKQTGDQSKIAAAQQEYDRAQENLKIASGTGIKDAETNVQNEKARLDLANTELEQAKQTGDQSKIAAAQQKCDEAKKSLQEAESYRDGLKEGYLEDVSFQSVQEKNAEKLEKNSIEKEEKLASQVAKDKNESYKSVAAAAVAGGISRGFYAAKSGFEAEKLTDIHKKVSEGVQKDVKKSAAIEKYYDSGGTGFADRTITQIEKSVGITTGYQQTQNQIKAYEQKIKANEALSTIESDVKAKVDATKSRAEDKLEKEEMKLSANGLEKVNINGRPVDVNAGESISDVYRKYKARSETAQSAADAAAKYHQDLIASGADKSSIDAAKKASEEAAAKAQEARYEKEQLKKKAVEFAFTQILRDKNPERNPFFDQVMVQKVKDMEKSIEIARSNPQTVDSIRKELGENSEEYNSFMSGQFANYDVLDRIQIALTNISNERNRENMEYKEGKRKLESSSRTDAQRAAEEYNPK